MGSRPAPHGWGGDLPALSYARPGRARDRDGGGTRPRGGRADQKGADPRCGSDPKERPQMTTVLDVQRYKDEGRRFAVLTASDFVSARIIAEAAIPILLVGH